MLLCAGARMKVGVPNGGHDSAHFQAEQLGAIVGLMYHVAIPVLRDCWLFRMVTVRRRRDVRVPIYIREFEVDL